VKLLSLIDLAPFRSPSGWLSAAYLLVLSVGPESG
jgi:hypothetical protein